MSKPSSWLTPSSATSQKGMSTRTNSCGTSKLSSPHPKKTLNQISILPPLLQRLMNHSVPGHQHVTRARRVRNLCVRKLCVRNLCIRNPYIKTPLKRPLVRETPEASTPLTLRPYASFRNYAHSYWTVDPLKRTVGGACPRKDQSYMTGSMPPSVSGGRSSVLTSPYWYRYSRRVSGIVLITNGHSFCGNRVIYRASLGKREEYRQVCGGHCVD